MYGEGAGPQSPAELTDKIRQIPVLAEVRRGAWIEKGQIETAETFVPFALEGYEHVEVVGYRLREAYDNYPDGAIVITVPWETLPVEEGDDVIVQRLQGELVEHSMWHVKDQGPGKDLVYQGKKLFTRNTLSFDEALENKYDSGLRSTPEGEVYYSKHLSSGDVMGVVVGCFWLHRRKPFKPPLEE